MARRNPTSVAYKGPLVRTPSGSLTHAASGGRPLCSKTARGVSATGHTTVTCYRCAKLLALNAGISKRKGKRTVVGTGKKMGGIEVIKKGLGKLTAAKVARANPRRRSTRRRRSR